LASSDLDQFIMCCKDKNLRSLAEAVFRNIQVLI
jgi:hypothetical protein